MEIVIRLTVRAEPPVPTATIRRSPRPVAMRAPERKRTSPDASTETRRPGATPSRQTPAMNRRPRAVTPARNSNRTMQVKCYINHRVVAATILGDSLINASVFDVNKRGTIFKM